MRLKTGILLATLLTTLAVCPFSSAFADEPTPNTSDSTNFILALSSKSNIPDGDLVGVVCGANSIYTGVNWVNPDGTVALKNQLGPNLLSFKKSVFYDTEWEELDEITQRSWGSEQNYNAANFCSQLDAYGLGDARDRYYATGGSNFSWTSDEESILSKIKGVYDDWSTGKDVLIGSVLGLFANDANDDFAYYLGASSDSFIIDGSKYNDWPSGAPTTLNVGFGSEFDIVKSNESVSRYATSESLYWIICHPSSSKYYMYPFSKNSFTFYWINSVGNVGGNYSVTNAKRDGQDYYYGGTQVSISGTVTSVNMPLNGDISSTNVQKIIPLLLFGDDLNASGTITPDIDGYPEDIQAHATVGSYYPTGGINNDTSWQKYLELIEEDTDDIATLLKRILTQVKLLDKTSENLDGVEAALDKFHFYANGILKVHDEGLFDSVTDIGSDISEIVSIIQNWHTEDNASQIIGDFDFPEYQTKAETLEETLDDIMPFGAIFLVSGLVGSIADINVVSEPKITIPWNFFPNHEEEIVIDVSWIEDGRNMIHAFMIFTLLLSLTMLTIGFVKSEV